MNGNKEVQERVRHLKDLLKDARMDAANNRLYIEDLETSLKLLDTAKREVNTAKRKASKGIVST